MTPRSVIDYALARRAVLESVRTRRTPLEDVCDADPYLLRAARFHGRRATRPCPVCGRAELWVVSWVYGDALRELAGSAREPAQLTEMDAHLPEFQVYDVEVCRSCSWNHLVASYTLGSAPAGEQIERKRRREQAHWLS